jgi:hypothetical protein
MPSCLTWASMLASFTSVFMVALVIRGCQLVSA